MADELIPEIWGTEVMLALDRASDTLLSHAEMPNLNFCVRWRNLTNGMRHSIALRIAPWLDRDDC